MSSYSIVLFGALMNLTAGTCKGSTFHKATLLILCQTTDQGFLNVQNKVEIRK